MLRDSALKIIRALKIEGGCNVQFALDPLSFKYYLIEVNPRVSRSSALASKASGYPIARVTAKVAVGLTLDEIRLANTPASFEPALDYVVTKVARFPFDKFSDASNKLWHADESHGRGDDAWAARWRRACSKRCARSRSGVCHIYHKKFDTMSDDEMLTYIKEGTDDRLYAIAQLIRNGVDLALIYNNTKIDMFFLEKFKNIVEKERTVAAHPFDEATLREAKRMGFGDKYIGDAVGRYRARDVRPAREAGDFPRLQDDRYLRVASSASYVPYFYSTYEQENESLVSDREKIIVLGSGPIRIGQGVEFDYSTVHAIWSIRKAGYEAIIINNNPETVSTDYTCSDKLYFEPLTVEDVMNVIHLEKPKGVVVSLGGQTAINLAEPLARLGVPIIGTDVQAIRNAEDRDCFEKIMEQLGIPQPQAEAVTDIEAGVAAATRIGYPVLVRPSYVLGGRAMQIVSNEEALRHYLQTAVEVNDDSARAGRQIHHGQGAGGRRHLRRPRRLHPRYHGARRADGHPLRRLDQRLSDFQRLAKSQGDDHRLYGQTGSRHRHRRPLQHPVHRATAATTSTSSRSTPVRRARCPSSRRPRACSMADIATQVILGHSLREQGITEVYGREKQRWYRQGAGLLLLEDPRGGRPTSRRR